MSNESSSLAGPSVSEDGVEAEGVHDAVGGLSDRAEDQVDEVADDLLDALLGALDDAQDVVITGALSSEDPELMH